MHHDTSHPHSAPSSPRSSSADEAKENATPLADEVRLLRTENAALRAQLKQLDALKAEVKTLRTRADAGANWQRVVRGKDKRIVELQKRAIHAECRRVGAFLRELKERRGTDNADTGALDHPPAAQPPAHHDGWVTVRDAPAGEEPEVPQQRGRTEPADTPSTQCSETSESP